MSLTLSSTPATDTSPAALARLFSAACSDYAEGPVKLLEGPFMKWCADNFVSLPRSHVFSIREDAVAFGLIGTRDDLPHTSRLAAIGVITEHKGKKLSKQVLEAVQKAEAAQ